MTVQKAKLSAARLAELASRFGVDTRTIRNAMAAGAPVDDVDALDKWFADSRNVPPTGGGKVGSLADAKLEKLRLECNRLKIKIDEDLKRLLPVDALRRDHVRIMNAMRADFLRFVGDIPNWSGMPPAEIKRRLDAKLDQLFDDLQNSFAEIGK
jgi:hypothetical protein